MTKKCKGSPPCGKICNPKTGLWVKKDGLIGRKILENRRRKAGLVNAKPLISERNKINIMFANRMKNAGPKSVAKYKARAKVRVKPTNQVINTTNTETNLVVIRARKQLRKNNMANNTKINMYQKEKNRIVRASNNFPNTTNINKQIKKAKNEKVNRNKSFEQRLAALVAKLKKENNVVVTIHQKN